MVGPLMILAASLSALQTMIDGIPSATADVFGACAIEVSAPVGDRCYVKP